MWEDGQPTLWDAARGWITQDPDPDTAAQLQQVVDSGDEEELAALMGGALSFGTAGLRGEVGPGPNRMNRAVVIRATQGLARHLLTSVDGAESRGVVVGHDARPDSQRFAEDVVTVLRSYGLAVAAFDRSVPTPVVAWEAARRGAAGAVVVTASHNPPADNGYKVYDEHAIQITPPTDAQIADWIERAPGAFDIMAAVRLAAEPAEVQHLGDDTVDEYVAAVSDAWGQHAGPGCRVVVTPLHGVGGDVVADVLQRLGHEVVRVDQQWEPDGTFPTVAFPNPEEPGALDLAIATAERHGVEVVLANDPDADRLAVALPDDGGRGGSMGNHGDDGDGWRRLSGDEVGTLLAHVTLQRAVDAGLKPPLVVNSIVSSARLGRVAAAFGARHEVTLTGFKWIWRAGRELAADGWEWVMGYEEALGYSLGAAVRDKDGISAAAVVADTVAALQAQGRRLGDLLEELDNLYGRWVNVQRSARFTGDDGPELMLAAVERAADVPADALGIRRIERVVDHRMEDADAPPWRPSSPLVVWHLMGGGRVLVRPSGTEPKLKVYVDVPLDDGDGPELGTDLATATLAALDLA